MCLNAGQCGEHAQHLVPVVRQDRYDRARNVDGGFSRHETSPRLAAPSVMASPGHAPTQSPHPVQVVSLTMAFGGKPMRGWKRMAEAAQASPQERQTMPASARQSPLMMATGLVRSWPRNSARREGPGLSTALILPEGREAPGPSGSSR